MPEMDGLEATRQIRQKWPGEAGPHIIAMTANVMPGDRERCLEAGMDDFVPKPIRIEALVEALRKAPTSHPSPVPLGREGADRRSAGEGGATILDPAALETLLGVIGGDEAMLRELIDSLLHDAPPLLADLRRALAQDDAAGIRRAAHTLKSSSHDFGATALAGLCQELEDKGREVRLEDAAGYVRRIEGEYAQVQEALASVEVRGGEIAIRRNVARRQDAPPQTAPSTLPPEAETVEQTGLPARPEEPMRSSVEVPSPMSAAHQPVTAPVPEAATQASGLNRSPLLPRGTRTLADLIGDQPSLLDELLSELLVREPEQVEAIEQWITELDAWHGSRPRLKKT
jgi:HPt (histidine-containing phosphotransfer) domain-containing protein